MTRGTIAELTTPWPLITTLPGIYQEDDLAGSLMRAFDDILAPIVSTIDNFDSYLDPALAPDDFLDWLAGWVGLLLDETWSVEQRRASIAVATELYRSRGTVAGLTMHLRLLTRGEVEVSDSGGSVWSSTPGAAAPGDGSYSVRIKVKPAKKGAVDVVRLDSLVAAAKPAHVTHALEMAE